MKKRMQNKKGFTLAELLIVVAIIAVLVAISIPVFTTQLEKAREATDAANIRSAYASIMAEALTNPDEAQSSAIALKQTQSGWQSGITDIGGIAVPESVGKNVTVMVKYDPSAAEGSQVTITTGTNTSGTNLTGTGTNGG